MKSLFLLIILSTSCAKIVKNFEIKVKDINDDLILAIKNNEKDKAIKLIRKGANINCMSNGETLLELSVAKRNLEIIEILMDAGAKLDKNIIMKIYSLALDSSYYDLIDKMKFKYKLEDGIIDNNKYFLLLCYTSTAQELKKFIKEKNIDVKEIKDKSCRNALIIACIGGNADTAKLLIEDYKMFIDYKNEYGFTPLMISLINKRTEVAKLLIEKGANVNFKSIRRDNALMIASENGCTEIVKLLLKKGSSVSEKNISNFTALILASEKGHTEIVKLLLKTDI